MKFKVITLFPEFIETLRHYSVIGRGIKSKAVELKTINLRDFGIGRYKQVDDKPYGGGPGMLLRVDVANTAIQAATKSRLMSRKVVLLSATGKQFDQKTAQNLSDLDELVVLCGHYEGVDHRIEKYIDETISIGPYVLSGGEIPAMLIIDAVSRLVPGVLQNPNSLKEESFSVNFENLKFKIENSNREYPQYTRPEVYRGKKVPEVLLSGDHNEIEKWREDHFGVKHT